MAAVTLTPLALSAPFDAMRLSIGSHPQEGCIGHGGVAPTLVKVARPDPTAADPQSISWTDLHGLWDRYRCNRQQTQA